MITKSSKIKVTSDFGIDITFSIEGRPAFSLAGRSLLETKYKADFLSDGLVAIAPVEGTAEGTLLVDASMHHIGKCETPIKMSVKNGKVGKIVKAGKK
jgi:leucyl aminopeptidase (aminopeptidase T)